MLAHSIAEAEAEAFSEFFDPEGNALGLYDLP